jgi:hypothetical protein
MIPTPSLKHKSEYSRSISRETAVLELGCQETLPTVSVTHSQCFHDLPRLEIGDTDVTDFAILDQVIQGAQSFLEWGQGIPHMDVKQVNDIGL